MKKLFLLLLLMTGFMQAQTLPSPSYNLTTTNTLKIKTPATVTSVNFLPAFDADGLTVSKIDPINLPFLNTSSTPQLKIGGLTLGANNSKPNDNWIALGTSVTFLNNYTAPASSQMNLIQINHGVSGSTSNDLVNHYSEIPTLNSGNQDQYRLLSIEHGINDAAQSVPLATFRANLEACIANAKGKNWPNNKILVINANYCNPATVVGLAPYASEAILIAKEQGVQYYDTYNYTFNNGALTLLSDGIHPTVAGGIIYARGLVASMQGGMEITNALTVDNQIVTNGIKVTNGSAQIGPSSGSSGKLIVSGDLTSTEAVARGINVFTNHIAGVNGQRLIALDLNPTFSANGFTGTQFMGINLNDIARIERQTNNTATIFKFSRTDNSQSSTIGHSGTGNYFITKALAVGSDLTGYPNTSGNLYVSSRIIVGSNTDDLTNKIQANGPIIGTALTLSTAPTTSAGTYDIITRNTSTGILEKVLSTSVQPTITATTSADYYRGDKTFQPLNGAVIGSVLSGFVAGSGAISGTDTVLQGMQKNAGNVALKADISSPTFTGDPKAPTPTAGDNDTSIATTAFVKNQSEFTERKTVALGHNSTVLNYVGLPVFTLVGTLGSNPVNTIATKYSNMLKVSARSATTAAASAGWWNGDIYSIYFIPEMEWVSEFYWSDDSPVNITDKRVFVGFKRTISAVGSANPSSLTAIVGMGSDDSDTNYQIFYPTTTTTTGKIDLGSDFNKNTVKTDFFHFKLWKIAGSRTIYYSVRNVINGKIATGNFTYGTGLDDFVGLDMINICNGATAAEARISISEVKTKTYY